MSETEKVYQMTEEQLEQVAELYLSRENKRLSGCNAAAFWAADKAIAAYKRKLKVVK